jgi:hypothetical protein
MNTAGIGLTRVPVDELKRLLRSLHRGEAPCPLKADVLACVGLQHRSEDLLSVLRGLDAVAVRAVLVSVIAERGDTR